METRDSAAETPRPVSTCCACVVHRGRPLLIQRAQDPGKGQWSFPGGRIELGETIFEAVTREAWEETGLRIEPLQTFQVYDFITRDDAGRVHFHFVVHYVRARHVSGEACARDDAAGVRWAAEAEIAGLSMHPFVHDTARRLLQETGADPCACW